jgi:hypothetical protein
MQKSGNCPKPSIKIFLITFIFFLVLSFEGFGQGLILDSLVAQFNHYQHKRIQEKIFVHTDKNFYVAGEIIWFKLYTVEAPRSFQQGSETSVTRQNFTKRRYRKWIFLFTPYTEFRKL